MKMLWAGILAGLLAGSVWAIEEAEQAADEPALDRGRADFQRAGPRENRDHGEHGEHSNTPPDAAFARGRASIRIVIGCCQPVIFQAAARTIASINLPLKRQTTERRMPKPLHS